MVEGGLMFEDGNIGHHYYATAGAAATHVGWFIIGYVELPLSPDIPSSPHGVETLARVGEDWQHGQNIRHYTPREQYAIRVNRSYRLSMV